MLVSKKLVDLCLSQNREAQKQLYELLLPYLRAIANRYLRDTSYTKDVLQESFVKIFRSMSQYNFEKGPFKQWAARITINNSLNYNKRVIGSPKDELVVSKHQGIVVPAVVEKWSSENMLLLLKQMPSDYFEVFNLSAIDGYSHVEIAEILNISEALSRKRLSRGKTWLKNFFQVEKDNLLRLDFPSVHLN